MYALQVTFRRMGCLYYVPYDTVAYIRGGRLAGSLFQNTAIPPVCDISILNNETPGAAGVWYGRVSNGLDGVQLVSVTQRYRLMHDRCLQVQLLLSVSHSSRVVDVVYVRWFNAPEDEWNRDLNLRPLRWHR